MADQSVPAPRYGAVLALKAILDTLLNNLGAEVAIRMGIIHAPWLGFPVVRIFYEWAVREFANQLVTGLGRIGGTIIIRGTKEFDKERHDKAMEKIRTDGKGMTDAELKAAMDAIHRIVHKYR